MRTAARVAALVFAAFLLLSFLDKFLLVELLARRTALPLALAFLTSVAIVGAGFAVRGLRGRVWRVESESAALDLPLDFIIGYPIFGTLCFLVATLNASTWTLMPLTIVCAIFGAFAIVRARESGVKSAPLAFAASDVFPLVAIALVFIAGLLAAQAPPLSLDELAYHLAVPHTWLLEGRAIELPLLSHSYFPLAI